MQSLRDPSVLIRLFTSCMHFHIRYAPVFILNHLVCHFFPSLENLVTVRLPFELEDKPSLWQTVIRAIHHACFPHKDDRGYLGASRPASELNFAYKFTKRSNVYVCCAKA